MSAREGAGPADGRPASPVRPPHPQSPVVAGGVSVIVLLAVTLAVVVLGVDDDREAPPAADVTARSPTPGRAGSPGSAPEVAPTGPGHDPALEVEGVSGDSFDRPDGALGAGADVGPWEVRRGEWAVEDGAAAATGGPEAGLLLATVDAGSVDVRAQVTLPEADDGAALAFRVVDDANYWMLAAAPGLGTFAVVEVVDGRPSYPTNSGLTRSRPGVTIGVHAEGSTVEVLVDGAVVATASDAEPEGTAVGLATAANVTSASFDDLLVLGL